MCSSIYRSQNMVGLLAEPPLAHKHLSYGALFYTGVLPTLYQHIVRSLVRNDVDIVSHPNKHEFRCKWYNGSECVTFRINIYTPREKTYKECSDDCQECFLVGPAHKNKTKITYIIDIWKTNGDGFEFQSFYKLFHKDIDDGKISPPFRLQSNPERGAFNRKEEEKKLPYPDFDCKFTEEEAVEDINSIFSFAESKFIDVSLQGIRALCTIVEQNPSLSDFPEKCIQRFVRIVNDSLNREYSEEHIRYGLFIQDIVTSYEPEEGRKAPVAHTIACKGFMKNLKTLSRLISSDKKSPRQVRRHSTGLLNNLLRNNFCDENLVALASQHCSQHLKDKDRVVQLLNFQLQKQLEVL